MKTLVLPKGVISLDPLYLDPKYIYHVKNKDEVLFLLMSSVIETGSKFCPDTLHFDGGEGEFDAWAKRVNRQYIGRHIACRENWIARMETNKESYITYALFNQEEKLCREKYETVQVTDIINWLRVRLNKYHQIYSYIESRNNENIQDICR